MVFVIQNTRTNGEAIQIKLDELIRAVDGAQWLLDLEELSESEFQELRKRYLTARVAREEV